MWLFVIKSILYFVILLDCHEQSFIVAKEPLERNTRNILENLMRPSYIPHMFVKWKFY
jgi:hypothetical protein